MSADGRRGFVTVDRLWLADPRLSEAGLRLMLWLDSHTDKYLGNLGLTRVAGELGWSRNKVKRAMANLLELELVSSEQIPMQGGGSRTRITLHHSRWSDRDAGPQRTSALVHDEARTVVHNGPPTYSNPNIEESSLETPLPPATTEVVFTEAEVFHRFWLSYPRKVGKPAALRAFKAAMKRDPIQDIANGVHAWIYFWKHSETEEQFIPHPATFLNQERYRDEPPPIVAGNSKSNKSMAAIQRLVERQA